MLNIIVYIYMKGWNVDINIRDVCSELLDFGCIFRPVPGYFWCNIKYDNCQAIPGVNISNLYNNVLLNDQICFF